MLLQSYYKHTRIAIVTHDGVTHASVYVVQHEVMNQKPNILNEYIG